MKKHFLVNVKRVAAVAALAAMPAFASCDRSPAPAVKDTVEMTVTDSTWTYFSLESGKTVGESRLMDEEADAAWAARRDWDIAVCGDLIRTNGGLSGSASGALLRDTSESYYTLSSAPSDGYFSDTLVVVKR